MNVNERIKEGARQLASGATAGFVEVCISHPLDQAKTRLQLGRKHYSGLVDVFRKTYTNEGVRGFYKGTGPNIVSHTLRRSSKFFAFEQYSKLFASDNMPGWTSLSLASVFSGFTEALIINPSEVLKVRLQVDLLTPVENQKSMATVAREIIREHGFFRKGLYSGFSATLMRDGVWNFFYFGIYHHIKHLAPDEQTSSTASIMNIPFDVAKSRIQSKSATDPKQRYFHTWQTIQLVRREEGFTALYRGFVPRVMRLGPGGGIMFVVFDQVNT